MPKWIVTAAAALALTMAVPGLAQSGSIKSEVSDSQLAAYCAEQGVGSKTLASLTREDGTTIKGSIHCEAGDLVVGDGPPLVLMDKEAREASKAEEKAAKSEEKAAKQAAKEEEKAAEKAARDAEKAAREAEREDDDRDDDDGHGGDDEPGDDHGGDRDEDNSDDSGDDDKGGDRE